MHPFTTTLILRVRANLEVTSNIRQGKQPGRQEADDTRHWGAEATIFLNWMKSEKKKHRLARKPLSSQTAIQSTGHAFARKQLF
jgi:hypothetical protein